jgi:hypothetical protein
MKKLILFIVVAVLVLINIKSWSVSKTSPCNLVLTSTTVQDIHAKIEMATAIEAIGSKHTSMRGDLSSIISNLKKSPEYGEIMLQKIMDLIEAEIVIVNHLLCAHTGASVEDAVNFRNHMLRRSIPSVAYIYDKIMDVATFDDETNTKLYRTGCCTKAITKSLNWCEKSAFLHSLSDKLNHYHRMMRDMQCSLSISDSRIMVPVNSDGAGLNFCPVIR